MSVKLKGLCRILAFGLSAVALFAVLTRVMERKTYSGAWNYMGKMEEFYSLPPDSLDYAVIGSSHAYCSVNPLEVFGANGIAGFVLATQQQPPAASYHYLKELFKTQSPKTVVLEGFMFSSSSQPEDAVICDAVDPLRTSYNKLELILELAPADRAESFVFNLFRYHSRWKNVSFSETQTAFEPVCDRFKGFVALSGSYTASPVVRDSSRISAYVPPENLETLSRIKALCDIHGARLAVMIAPCDSVSAKHLAAVEGLREWALTNGATFWDYSTMTEELKIDFEKDWYDGGHLDVSGAAKLSRDLALKLAETGCSPASGDAAELFEADRVYYADKFAGELDF